MSKSYFKDATSEESTIYYAIDDSGPTIIGMISDSELCITVNKVFPAIFSEVPNYSSLTGILESDYEELFNTVDRLGVRPSTHPPH